MKEFFKKHGALLVLGACIALLLLSTVFSVVAYRSSRKALSQIETISSDYLNFTHKISVKLDSIDDNVEFMKDFVLSSAGGVHLGDTYLNNPKVIGDHSKIKK